MVFYLGSMQHSQFNQCPIHGHFSRFPGFAVTNSAAVKRHIHMALHSPTGCILPTPFNPPRRRLRLLVRLPGPSRGGGWSSLDHTTQTFFPTASCPSFFCLLSFQIFRYPSDLRWGLEDRRVFFGGEWRGEGHGMWATRNFLDKKGRLNSLNCVVKGCAGKTCAHSFWI